VLRRLFILLAVCALALAGCTTPDNPVVPGSQGNQENQENQGSQGTTPVEKTGTITLTLCVSTATESQEYAFPTTKANDVKLRYTLRFYRAEEASGWASSPEVEKVIYLDAPYDRDFQERIELKLDAYKMLAWADYVKDNANWFWNPADLSKVEYAAASYQGTSEYKQCYYGTLELDLRRDENQIKSLGLHPAGSSIRILATDSSSFEGKDLTAVISYLDPIPLSFDVGHFSPIGGQSGLSFSSPVKKLDNGTISIADDYILLGVDTSIGATLTLQEKDGTVLLKKDITIPLKRSCNTILKGELLSAGGDAGISVDLSFEGEYDSNF